MNETICKIVFVIPVFKAAGAEKNIKNIVNHLNKNDYQISILAGKTEENFKSQLDERVKLVNFNVSYLIFLFLSLIGYLRKEKPDILVSALPHVNIICVAARIFSGVKTKIILTEHSILSLLPHTARTAWRRFVARFILPHFVRFFYPKADMVIGVSKGVMKDLLSVVPKLKKTRIIYNAVVDESMFVLALEPVENNWFLNPKEPVILAVGRLVKAKDYPTLLKAFKLVLQSHFAKLVILGEGDEEKKLKKFSQELGVEKDAAFLGFQKNPYKYMARSSLLALSSTREGFGNVIAEAMALDLPVVATDCVGPKEIIENEENGILVPVGDEKSLAEAIIKIFNDNSLAKKLSDQGKKRAQDFTAQKSAQEYEKVFKEILTNK